jgi:hypothetical protein
MNSYELERLAKQRTADIRKAAAQRPAATRRDHARSIRHRTGWALIQIGLSLITKPGQGSGLAPAGHRSGLGSAHPAA